jgi:hypothetical protein
MRRRGVEVTQRVVGQCREAQHGVVAGQLAGVGLPHVKRGPVGDVLRAFSEVTPFIEVQDQPMDLVPGRAQQGNENSADVATIACNQDPHAGPPDFLRTSWTG